MEKLINISENNTPYLELGWEDCICETHESVEPNSPLVRIKSLVITGPTIHKLYELQKAYEELLEEIDCLKTERTELKDKIEFMEKEWENFEKAFSQVGTIISCSENHRVYCGECAHSEVCSADNQLIKRLNGDKCKHYNKKNKKK